MLSMNATKKIPLPCGFLVFLGFLQNVRFAEDCFHTCPQFMRLVQLLLKPGFLRISGKSFFQKMDAMLEHWFRLCPLRSASYKDFLLPPSAFPLALFFLLPNLLLDLRAQVEQPGFIGIRRKATFDFSECPPQVTGQLQTLRLLPTLTYEFFPFPSGDLAL